MRRAIRVLFAAGALLTVAACGAATDDAGAATAAAGVPSVDPATASACEALSRAYGEHLAPFAESLSGLVADHKATAPAKQALTALAGAVQKATETSPDAAIRADGKQAAEKMRATSADVKFFAGIKTAADVDTAMSQTLTGWLSPLARHCS